ncbi:Fibronectin type III protein [compost metagenome]
MFNSDELSFYANGERALWFDLPSREFIFGGNLQAAGGTFSGDLSAVGGTFTGTLVGVDGTFSGTVSAGRVEASDIVGAFIQGSTITGTTMIGNTIMTATTGERIELTPSGFRFYDSFNAQRVTLGTNPSANISGHTYYNSSSQSQGLIYAVSDALHVIGVNGMLLRSLNGAIVVQGVLDLRGATVLT